MLLLSSFAIFLCCIVHLWIGTHSAFVPTKGSWWNVFKFKSSLSFLRKPSSSFLRKGSSKGSLKGASKGLSETSSTPFEHVKPVHLHGGHRIVKPPAGRNVPLQMELSLSFEQLTARNKVQLYQGKEIAHVFSNLPLEAQSKLLLQLQTIPKEAAQQAEMKAWKNHVISRDLWRSLVKKSQAQGEKKVLYKDAKEVASEELEKLHKKFSKKVQKKVKEKLKQAAWYFAKKIVKSMRDDLLLKIGGGTAVGGGGVTGGVGAVQSKKKHQ